MTLIVSSVALHAVNTEVAAEIVSRILILKMGMMLRFLL
jgi:hypothetical protein